MVILYFLPSPFPSVILFFSSPNMLVNYVIVEKLLATAQSHSNNESSIACPSLCAPVYFSSNLHLPHYRGGRRELCWGCNSL